MTTAHSPDHIIRAQAKKIVRHLKAAEKNDWTGVSVKDSQLNTARQMPGIKVGVAMDDKIVRLELSWVIIRDTEDDALVEYIVKLMREKKDDA